LYDLGWVETTDMLFSFLLVPALVFGRLRFFNWETEGDFVRLRSSFCIFMKVYCRRRDCIRRGLLSLMVRYVVTSKSSR
jgi:hypothetical protein